MNWMNTRNKRECRELHSIKQPQECHDSNPDSAHAHSILAKGEGTLRTINHATDEHITTFGYQSFALSPPRRQVHFANTIPSYIPDAPEWSKQEQIFFLQRYDYDYDFPIFPTPFPPSIAHPRLQTTVWLAGLCVMVDADMEAMDGGIAGYRGKKANTNETNNTKTRLEPYRFEANLRANVVRLGGELGGC